MTIDLMPGSIQVRRGFVVAPVGYYLDRIEELTPDFTDDGLSCFPDWIYRYVLRLNISPAGRVHDWHYCSRAHGRGTMNQTRRLFADLALRTHARELLSVVKPSRFRLLRFVRRVRARMPRLAPIVLYAAVRAFGGTSAFDSCGPKSGARCRHNLTAPRWYVDAMATE